MKIKLSPPDSKRCIEFVIPDSMNSLNSADLIRLAELSHSCPKYQALILFVIHISGLRVETSGSYGVGSDKTAWILRRGLRGKRMLISDRDMLHLASLLDWVYVNDELNVSLSALPSDFCRFIPRKLCVPGPAFTTLSFEQYTHADTHFHNFAKNSDIDELNKMICAITAAKFDSETYLNNTKRVAAMPYWLRIVIFWYYMGSKKTLSLAFPNLFSAGSGDGEAKQVDVYMQYMELTSSMCESPADIIPTEKTLAWKIFSYLEAKIKANKKLEESLKKYK